MFIKITNIFKKSEKNNIMVQYNNILPKTDNIDILPKTDNIDILNKKNKNITEKNKLFCIFVSSDNLVKIFKINNIKLFNSNNEKILYIIDYIFIMHIDEINTIYDKYSKIYNSNIVKIHNGDIF